MKGCGKHSCAHSKMTPYNRTQYLLQPTLPQGIMGALWAFSRGLRSLYHSWSISEARNEFYQSKTVTVYQLKLTGAFQLQNAFLFKIIWSHQKSKLSEFIYKNTEQVICKIWKFLIFFCLLGVDLSFYSLKNSSKLHFDYKWILKDISNINYYNNLKRFTKKSYHQNETLLIYFPIYIHLLCTSWNNEEKLYTPLHG